MYHLILVVLAILGVDVGFGQPRYSWLPEELPNPQNNPRACGLGIEPGYICDPNHILSKRELETVNWHLEGIAETQGGRCPCSQWYCDKQARARLPHFYQVAIALIPSLRLPRDTLGREVEPLDQAQTFAFRLENQLWNISACEEDIVILYSRDDNALVTMAGATARQQLDAFSRRTIHAMVGGHFAEGRIVEGLLRMVYEIDLVLNGNRYQDYMAAGQTSDSHRLLPSLSLIIPLTAVIMSITLRH